MFRRIGFGLTALVVSSACPSAPADAAWPHDPVNGNAPVCTATNNQTYPLAVSDGAGGVIVTWTDSRPGIGSPNVNAQRIDAAGNPVWAMDGIVICAAAGAQTVSGIVSDGAGGVIIAWSDARAGNWDIYAQRVNSAGVTQWAANGVALCTNLSDQLNPTMTSDGAGGAILAWQDYRGGASSDIYVRRINSSGTPQWGADGVGVCTAAGNQGVAGIVPDGSGGAILAWDDQRIGGNFDVYARRVYATGMVVWTSNGVLLSSAPNGQLSPTIASDATGGAIIAWVDGRSGTSNDIYAQRISSGGGISWTTDGIAIVTGAGDQLSPFLLSDGAGGAFIAWTDARSGVSDIYARRISSGGSALWTPNGVAVCTATGDQKTPQIVSDGAGGVIIGWTDDRSPNDDIYAQRVNATGVPQWAANGGALSTAGGNQFFPAGAANLVSDGASGASAVWPDQRGGNDDVYAQQINRSGYLASPEPAI